jgi:hypothetical protein
MKISLSLCLSFFTSSYLPFLLFRVSHMGSLYVLMSKGDHLHDLAICVSWFCSFPSAGPVPRRLYPLLVSLSVLYPGIYGEAHLSLLHNSQRLWLSDSTCFRLLIFVVFLLTGNASTPLLCCISRVLLSRRDTALIATPTLQPMGQTHRVLRTQSSRLTMPLTSMSRSLFLDAISSTKSLGASRHTILNPATNIRRDADRSGVVDV